MENNLTQQFVRYGLIVGLLQVIIAVITYVAGVDTFANHMILFSVLMLVVAVAISIFVITSFRKNNGGYMTLKEGFMVTFFTFAIAGLITTVFGIILYQFIDPEYPKQLAEKITIATQEMMEKFGASEADIEKAMERQGDMSEKFTVGGQIRSYLTGLIAYAIYAVILSAIFKKSKPPFEEQITQPNS
jgi:magnesium-transporting ATPase (P-type)